MPQPSMARDKVLDQLVERQINWNHLQRRVQELSDRAEQQAKVRFGPFLTISREYGAGGAELATRVGERLGWSVIDREIVEHLSDQLKIDHNVIKQLDEAGANWVRDLIGDLSLAPAEVITRDSYVTHLERVVKMTALHGKIIFVGRGAQFFLPRSQGLRIRLVAEERDCVARIRERHRMAEKEARKLYRSKSEARHELVQRYFGLDPSDPLLYDLVLNSSQLSLEQLAELVVCACRQRNLS